MNDGGGIEYFWLAQRIVDQMFRLATEQQREEIVAEAVCAAWCSSEQLKYRLMRQCVRWAGYKHLSHQVRSFPILMPLHTLQDELVPEPELPYLAEVIKLNDRRKMPTNVEKLAFYKQAN